jgi:hypothetical protein
VPTDQDDARDWMTFFENGGHGASAPLPTYKTLAKWPEIRVSGGFFAASGLVFSYPIRFHCTPSGVPLIP